MEVLPLILNSSLALYLPEQFNRFCFRPQQVGPARMSWHGRVEVELSGPRIRADGSLGRSTGFRTIRLVPGEHGHLIYDRQFGTLDLGDWLIGQVEDQLSAGLPVSPMR